MNPTYVYHYDGNGNVVRLTDTNGAVVSTVDYTPFGSVLALSGPYTPRYQFSTKEYDGVVGLNYYGYRFYSSALGRWFSRDLIHELGGLNLYVFSRNNGVNSVDVLGLACTLTTLVERYAGSYAPLDPILDALARHPSNLIGWLATIIATIEDVRNLLGRVVGVDFFCSEMPDCYLLFDEKSSISYVGHWFDEGPAGGPDLTHINLMYDVITTYIYGPDPNDPCCNNQKPSGKSCTCGTTLITLPRVP